MVRPDQHVAHVLPIDAHATLAAYFAGFMIDQAAGNLASRQHAKQAAQDNELTIRHIWYQNPSAIDVCSLINASS